MSHLIASVTASVSLRIESLGLGFVFVVCIRLHKDARLLNICSISGLPVGVLNVSIVQFFLHRAIEDKSFKWYWSMLIGQTPKKAYLGVIRDISITGKRCFFIFYHNIFMFTNFLETWLILIDSLSLLLCYLSRNFEK